MVHRRVQRGAKRTCFVPKDYMYVVSYYEYFEPNAYCVTRLQRNMVCSLPMIAKE